MRCLFTRDNGDGHAMALKKRCQDSRRTAHLEAYDGNGIGAAEHASGAYSSTGGICAVLFFVAVAAFLGGQGERIG